MARRAVSDSAGIRPCHQNGDFRAVQTVSRLVAVRRDIGFDGYSPGVACQHNVDFRAVGGGVVFQFCAKKHTERIRRKPGRIRGGYVLHGVAAGGTANGNPAVLRGISHGRVRQIKAIFDCRSF